MNKIGLVLEGGGMKGMFTAGVLDFFMEKNLEFAEIIGVSAGAIHACSFISKQRERSKNVTLEFINDKRYCSFKSLRQTGDLFNAKFSYYDIPEKYYPFDLATFKKNKTKFLVGVTNVETGEAEYLEINNFEHGEIEAVRASASLPMVANIVEYQGKKYLDGGITDQIPLRKMEADGIKKSVVISTKPAGWRRKPSKAYLLMKRKYKEYPKIVEKIKNRHLVFNETMDYIEKQVKENKVFFISATEDLKVKRIDKNLTRLEKAYRCGYETAQRLYPDLITFMGK